MSDSESDYESEEEAERNLNPRLRRNTGNKVRYRDDSEDDESGAEKPPRVRQKRMAVKVDTNRAKLKKISYKEESSEDELEEQYINAGVKQASNFTDIMAKMKTNREAVYKSASRESSENDIENERAQEGKSKIMIKKSNYTDLMAKMKTNKHVAIQRYSSKETSEEEENQEIVNEKEAKKITSGVVSITNEKHSSSIFQDGNIENTIESQEDDCQELSNEKYLKEESDEPIEVISNEEKEQSSEFDSEDYENEIEEKPKKRVKTAESDSDFEPDEEELKRVNKRVRKQVRYNTSDLFDSEADSEDDEEWQFWRNARRGKGPPRERRNKGPVYSDDSDDLTASDIHSNEVIFQRDLDPDQQIELEAWGEFVNFSQHVVAPIGTGGSKKKKNSILWEIEFTDAWNPYTAGTKEVSMFLTLHKDQLKITKKDLDIRTNAVDKYLPDINIKETGINCPRNQKFPYPLVILMDKRDLKYQDEWNHFIKYCVHTAGVDPFLAKPSHVRNFILGLFLNQKDFAAVLKPFPHFYQENINHLLKALGFYLKSAYDKNPLTTSSEIREIYSVAECLDERLPGAGALLERLPGAGALLERLPGAGALLERLPGAGVLLERLPGAGALLERLPGAGVLLERLPGAGDLLERLPGAGVLLERLPGAGDLLERMTPAHWYSRYNSVDHKKDFWQHGLVRRILCDVQNKILSENDAAWQLGVTADMVACAVQRAKPENDEDLSLTVNQYLELQFGNEENFWKEDSTQNLIEDVRNRVITVDNAAFQLGITYAKVIQNVGEIKSEAEVEAEKAALKEKQQKAKQTSHKPKLSPLELQIKMAEGKNEDEMSAYEKMRLNNMRQKLEIFRMMGLEEERQSYKESEPTSKRVLKNTYIAPREKSSRLKKIADQKEIERETFALYEDFKVKRQSPVWVGRFTPSQKSRHLCDEEMRTLLHVPKVTIGTNQLIANNLDYHKGERFMQRLAAEVEYLGEETTLEGNGIWEGFKSIGGGKVSNQELVSLDMRGEIVAAGDKMGGVGFWLGQKSLVYRPHNAAVCRTVFVGCGEETHLVSASHDGTVRVLDFAKQEFTLMYSWHKQSTVKQGVVWLEPQDRNSWLLNIEGGSVLQLDRRDPKVKSLLELKEAKWSSYQDYGRGGGRGGGMVVTPALTGSKISVHPVNKSLISICDKETVDIYDIRNVKACVTSIHHPNPPASRGNAQFDTMNYYAGSGWSASGAHFMTCPRLKSMQGSINTQSAHHIDGGQVREWPGEKHQSVTAVNLLICEGAVWCPWEENIFFASVNKKPGGKSIIGSNWGLVGVDVESGETVMDINLSGAANLMGLHPCRPQIVVGNSSGPGVVEIFTVDN